MKSREGQARRQDLETMKEDLEGLRDELMLLAEEDAKAYDGVVASARSLRKKGGTATGRAHQRAIERASEVPARTAEACGAVLEYAARLAKLSRKSTLSDLETAVALAQAGVRGAYLNVSVNLDWIADAEFVRLKRSRMDKILNHSDELARQTLGPMKIDEGSQK